MFFKPFAVTCHSFPSIPQFSLRGDSRLLRHPPSRPCFHPSCLHPISHFPLTPPQMRYWDAGCDAARVLAMMSAGRGNVSSPTHLVKDLNDIRTCDAPSIVGGRSHLLPARGDLVEDERVSCGAGFQPAPNAADWKSGPQCRPHDEHICQQRPSGATEFGPPSFAGGRRTL